MDLPYWLFLKSFFLAASCSHTDLQLAVSFPHFMATEQSICQTTARASVTVCVWWQEKEKKNGNFRRNTMYVSCLSCWALLIELGQIRTFINCDINHYLELADAVAPG